MAHSHRLFVAVLTTYRVAEGHDLRELIARWKDPTIPMETRLRTVETVALMTWEALRHRGTDLPPPDLRNFLARSIDATATRLIICAGATIVVDAAWPRASTLASWHIAVDQLAQWLQRFADHEDPTGPQKRIGRS